MAQLQDNLASLDLEIPGHPYDFLDKDLLRQLAFAGMADQIDNHH